MILRKAIGILLVTSSLAGISAIPAEAESVIHITTASELAAISNDTNGSYVLDNDIHLSGTWTPIAGYFTGVFDGNGHKITGLRINSTGSMLGLFERIGLKGEVKNVDIYGSISGVSFIGAIAGEGHGSISGCNSYVTITGTGQYVGGIVGMTEGYGMTHCINYGSVTGNTSTGGIAGYVGGETVLNCINLGTITGNDDYTGGIVGINRGIISACYNSGAVNGDYGVGGVVGYNRHSVINCYNTATVSSASGYYGGVVGMSEDAAGSSVQPVIQYCYNIGELAGSPYNKAGIVGDKDNTTVTKCVYLSGIPGIGSGNTYADTVTALSLNQFKSENYFSGWDLDSVWAMSAERPVLRAIPELEILREPATASAVKLGEYASDTDTDKKAFAWKVTVTPGTDTITDLNVKINNIPANETEGISTPKISGGAIVFGIVVNILGSNDVTSVTAVVNGEDIAASIE